MLKKLIAALTVAFVCASALARDDKDDKAIQGSWSVVEITKDGKPAPADEVKDIKVIFTEGKVALKLGDLEVGKATFKLDPAKKHLDMTPEDGANKGKLQPGLYELKGDSLKLCLAEPGNERPKEFKSTEKSGIILVVLKRDKK